MRITKEMKDSIVTKAIAFKFKDAEADIERRRRELGPVLYRHAVSEEDEARVKALPNWQQWCYAVTGLTVTCEGYTSPYNLTLEKDRYFAHLSSAFFLDDPRPWCASANEYVKLKVGHPLFRQFAAVYKSNLKLETEKKELREKLRILLASCTTRKQLMAAWPEGERFFPQETKYSTALVPVSLAADITKMLGLKPASSPATNAVRKAATAK